MRKWDDHEARQMKTNDPRPNRPLSRDASTDHCPSDRWKGIERRSPELEASDEA